MIMFYVCTPTDFTGTLLRNLFLTVNNSFKLFLTHCKGRAKTIPSARWDFYFQNSLLFHKYVQTIIFCIYNFGCQSLPSWIHWGHRSYLTLLDSVSLKCTTIHSVILKKNECIHSKEWSGLREWCRRRLLGFISLPHHNTALWLEEFHMSSVFLSAK
jgi:hypothetical protein